MKKNEYVAPEMEIVEIKTESFIAASLEAPGQGGIDDLPGEGFDGDAD